MAVIQNYINTSDKENVGNVQCYKRWGKYVLRTVPYNPRTPAQQAHRMRFKKLSLLVHQVIDCINLAYAGSVKGIGMNPYNRVMGINTKNCFVSNTGSIDPGLLVLCENDGSFVNNVMLSSTTANTIIGTFNSNTQNADEDDDPVKAYGFDVAGNKIWPFGQEAIRSTGTIKLTNPETSGLNIAVYFECLDRVNLLNGNPKHVIKYVGTITVL
jgi:hypothetical protein